MITSKKIFKLEKSIKAIEKEQSIPYCPSCGSTNVTGDGALIRTNSRAMLCKECSYKDINFPEKIIKMETKK